MSKIAFHSWHRHRGVARAKLLSGEVDMIKLGERSLQKQKFHHLSSIRYRDISVRVQIRAPSQAEITKILRGQVI